MNNILIKIYYADISTIIKLTYSNNINIYNIKEEDKYILCEINKDDLKKINKLFKVDIVKDRTFKTIINNIKSKISNVILFLIGIILFIFLSNVIVNITITSNNIELNKSLIKSLDNLGIKRLSLKKDFIKIQEIKNKIMEEYKDKLEWFEIESIGMTYNIKLEERKIKLEEINEGKCNVIASTDGLITKIIANQGVVMVKNNQNVKEGDLLITGQIMLNDEIK